MGSQLNGRGADEPRKINLAIAGVGNCASALIEGISHYRQHPGTVEGLLFPTLCGYAVPDIHVVTAFDISSVKVGLPVRLAIYRHPNNFIGIKGSRVLSSAPVFRGPTLDGNPGHLARFVNESSVEPVDVVSVLKDYRVDVLVNMLPTGSNQAAEFYGCAALDAGCAFINCIPTPLARKEHFQKVYSRRRLPLFGDDIKSQMGTTILHRALLGLVELRGGVLKSTSQINVGGNTDFANFVYRAETKLVSKRKSLQRYLHNGEEVHVGHHYDPTAGPLKKAFIEMETRVFGGSSVKIDVRLESDDKPNCAGSVVDLVRIAKGALDIGAGGCVPEACAFYMNSPPVEMDDLRAFQVIRENWNWSGENFGSRYAGKMDTKTG